MPVTFCSVVLGQPEIASLVFEFQRGLYDDVRSAFRAYEELIEFDATRDRFECDVSFAKAFAPHAAWEGGLTFSYADYFTKHGANDARLPLHMAIAQGLVQLTKRMLRCRPDLVSEDAIVVAFYSNRLEMVELLLDERTNVPELRRNAENSENDGRVQGNTCRILSDMLSRDDASGVELLWRFGLRRGDFARRVVVFSNRLPTSENFTRALAYFPWLLDLHPRLLDAVAAGGLLPLVRVLHERGVGCSVNAMDGAADNGHLEVVCFLHLHRSEGCTVMAMDDAATWGHLDVVEFLHVNRTEGCTVDALDGAITHGHVDVLRFLIEHRSEGASPNILDLAAANGHLDVVKYLHSLGSFGCTVAAVDKAVNNGHLKVVTFLLTNRREGCTRDTAVRKALKSGHLRTAEYLLSLGYPFPTTEFSFYLGSFDKPEMPSVLQLLLARGMPCASYWIAQASAVNNVPLVRFLHEHPNHSCHPKAMQAAIVNEAWDVVDFLLANCTAKVAVDALRAALSFSNLDVSVRMLQRHPELRNDNLLALAIHSHDAKVTGYLLAAGVGKPRECLIDVVGRRNYVTTSNLLLPYCMGATDHIGNVTFLLDLLELPDSRRARRRATTLQLISPELMFQGRKACQTIQLSPSVVARATSWRQAGKVVDWALALVIGHLHATATAKELMKWTRMVHDAELSTQLHDLLSTKSRSV